MPTANINGVNIYYEVRGNKNSDEAIVFFNGVAASVASWDYQYPVFKNLPYKLIYHDYRGQLLSEKPGWPYSFDKNVEDAKALFDLLKVKKIKIIAISYGGIVALRFTLKYPEMVNSISLVNTLIKPDEYMKFIDRVAIKHMECTPKVDGAAFYLDLVPKIFSKKFMKENRDLILKNADEYGQLPQDFFKAQIDFCKIFLEDQFDENLLKKIKCPVQVIASEEDKLTPVYYSQEIVAKIQHAEYVMIPYASHASIAEIPGVYNSALLGFILKNK